MKLSLMILTLLLCNTLIHAQFPDGFSYQAVIRDPSGELLVNWTVSLRITIHRSSANGTVVFQETHDITTNDFGIVNLVIGQGILNSGSFSTIEWSSYLHFLQTEVNIGSGFINLSTQQLLGVPYAMASKTAQSSLYATDMVLDDLTDVDGGDVEDGAVLRWNLATDHWEPGILTSTGWGLSGNAGSNESINFLGTTDLKDFSFRTNNIERMRIKSTGFIGIGIAVPQRNFHIHSAGIDAYQVFTNAVTGNTYNDGMLFGNLGATGYVYNMENADLNFGTNSLVRATITAEGRFVVGSSTAEELVHFENSSWQLHLENSSTADYWNVGASGSNWGIGSGKFAINNGSSSTNAKFVIDGLTGNVGIGDVSPDQKLDVQGSIESSNLSGTGIRHVYADANGVIHTSSNDDDKYYLTIPGQAFTPSQPVGSDLDATMDYLISERGFEFWDDDGAAYTGIVLPDGAKITGVTAYMIDNFPDNNIYIQVDSRYVGANSAGNLYMELESTGSSGYQSDSNTFNTAVINNAAYTYFIRAYVNPLNAAPDYDDLTLKCITIEYQLHQ